MKKILTVVIPLAYNSEPSVVKSLDKFSDKIEIIVERGLNPSKNRNLGIKKSKTPLVAFLNAHSSVDKNWLKNIISFFKAHPDIDVLGGPQHNSSDEPSFGRASGYAMSSRFGSGGIWRRYAGKDEILNADETMITSANLICKSKVFTKVRFNEKLYPGEDPKFISDSKRQGFKVAYSPKIIVYNQRRKTLYSLFKQVFGYGKTRPIKESFIETLKKPFFLVPTFFVLYLFSLLFYQNIVYSIPLISYLILMTFFTVFISIKKRDLLAMFYLPIIFFTIHLAYGLGFIYGSIIKIIRKRK